MADGRAEPLLLQEEVVRRGGVSSMEHDLATSAVTSLQWQQQRRRGEALSQRRTIRGRSVPELRRGLYSPRRN